MKCTTISLFIVSVIIVVFCCSQNVANSFPIVLMGGARRGKGALKRSLESDTQQGKPTVKSVNKGKGQEITGVTIPAEGLYGF